MKVLGLSPLDKDSTVTLVEDGAITYAAAEERFTRVKLQDGFPWHALDSALETTGTQIGEIDRVVYPFLTFDEETRLFERNLAKERDFLDETEAGATADELRERAGARSRGPAAGPGPAPIRTSGWRRACSRASRTASSRARASCRATSPSAAPSGGAAMPRRSTCGGSRSSKPALDGARAGRQAQARRAPRQPRRQRVFHQRLRRGADRHARRLRVGPVRQREHRPRRPHRADSRSGVPALARHVLRIGDVGARVHSRAATRARSSASRPTATPRCSATCCGAGSCRTTAASASSRRTTSTSRGLLATQFPKIDVAAAYQRVLEEVATAYVSQYVRKTGLRNLVLSGGVVANVKLNQRLREIDGVERHLHPSEHGRRRLRHRRRAARVRRAGADLRRRLDRRLSRARRSRAARSPTRSTRAQLPFTRVPADRAQGRDAAGGRQGRGALRRAHGVRPARARPPVDPLPREGAGREPVAEPAAGPHGVHAVRAGDAVRASRRLLPEHRRRRVRRASS